MAVIGTKNFTTQLFWLCRISNVALGQSHIQNACKPPKGVGNRPAFFASSKPSWVGESFRKPRQITAYPDESYWIKPDTAQ